MCLFAGMAPDRPAPQMPDGLTDEAGPSIANTAERYGGRGTSPCPCRWANPGSVRGLVWWAAGSKRTCGGATRTRT